MPSTYTTNLGIEKIATGEQSGVWGATTNTNLDILDQAVNGIVSVTLASAGTSGSPNTLPVTSGALSDGRNKFIEFVDGGDLGATAYVQLTPNDAEKVVFMRNSLSGSRSVIVFQGTYNASNDFEIPAGKDVVLKFDGAGASATVTNVFNSLRAEGVSLASGTTVTAILDEDDMSSDSDTALATQQSIKAYVDSVAEPLTAVTTDILPNTDDNNDLGSASKRWADLYLSGGVYLGGTTSANYLSDYEEGTAVFPGSGPLETALSGTVSSYYAEYVKIGRVVHIYGKLTGSSLKINAGTSPGYLIYGALPFVTTNAGGGGGVSSRDNFTGVVGDGSSYGIANPLSEVASVAKATASEWAWGSTEFTSSVITSSIVYHTDS